LPKYGDFTELFAQNLATFGAIFFPQKSLCMSHAGFFWESPGGGKFAWKLFFQNIWWRVFAILQKIIIIILFIIIIFCIFSF
jgi:hypothetical protein